MQYLTFQVSRDCTQALIEQRWPESFRCPSCVHDKGYVVKTRGYWKCDQCHKQTSLKAENSLEAYNKIGILILFLT